jgi:Tol biopolymer transport system component
MARVESGKVNAPAELIKANTGPANPLGITKSGTLYYRSGDYRTNLYIADLDSAMKATKPPVLATDRFLNTNGRASWSRDGRYLAYYSFRTSDIAFAQPATLVIRTVATGDERDIPLQLSVARHNYAAPPRWFPDGRSVVVAALRPNQPGVGYFRVDLTSGKTDLLAHSEKTGVPEWEPELSPDGKTLFYVNHRDTGPNELVRFDIESRNPTTLRAADGAVSVAVSPDGSQLAYISGRTIQVMPSLGGESRMIYRASAETAAQSTVVWTPDQRNLLFVHSRGIGETDTHVLWRVPVDGGRAEEVGMSRKGGHPFSVQVHPDGHRITFEWHEGSGSEVWALENFLPRASAAR